MSETIANLRARIEKVTSPETLGPDHGVWGVLDKLEVWDRAGLEPSCDVPDGIDITHARLIWWLLDDLMTATELAAQAHVKIVAQQVELEAWRNSASVLSQMLASIVRRGHVSLSGRAGEARRAAVAYVAQRSSRDDVLGVQPPTKRILRPLEAKRGLRAVNGGFHDVEETAPL